MVELERVEEIVELSVLGSLVESNEVLLQSVKGEFLLVVDVDFERLAIHKISRAFVEAMEETTHRLHKLLASRSNFLRKRSGEHHNLLVVRS